MLTGEVFSVIEKVAPLSLQCDFDNSGLIIGSAERQVSGVMLCLDLTPSVIREAADKGCNLIITHHPLIFRPIKGVVEGDYVSDLIAEAIRLELTVYSSHTPLDCARGGINDMLADMAGITVDMGKEGDFYRCGTIAPCSAEEYAHKIKAAFSADSVRLIGKADNIIGRAAVSSGSGGRDEDMFNLLIGSGCDIIITSEIKHNLAVQCFNTGICAIEITHFDSEKHSVQLLGGILRRAGINAIEAECASPYSRVI